MSRRPFVVLVTALLLAVPGTLTAASAGPPPVTTGTKAYAASAPSPVQLPPAGTAALTVVLTNCGPCADGTSSTLPFGSAEVRLPAGLVPAAPLDGSRPDLQPSVDRAGWSAVWPPVVADSTGRTLRLVSSGKGSTAAVPPGASVRLTVPLASSSAAGSYLLRTEVRQSNDFSGSGNGFALVGSDPTVTVASAPPAQAPHSLRFQVQPSTVQSSGSGAATSASTTPVLTMCPAVQVRVVDPDGVTVTSLPSTPISLAPVAADPGLRLAGGPAAAATVAGVATFGSADGSCASGLTASVLGTGYRLTASASVDGQALTTPTPSSAFDVLPVYALCAQSCTSPTLTGAGTTAQVVATNGTSVAPLTFSVGLDTWDDELLGACEPDPGPDGPNPYRAAVTVDLADHDKSVQLTWSKDAVQWATNNGSSQWRICFAAVYPFPAVGGPAASVGGWRVGELLPCGDPTATGPCVAALSRTTGGRQTATVEIPDADGDPRMI